MDKKDRKPLPREIVEGEFFPRPEGTAAFIPLLAVRKTPSLYRAAHMTQQYVCRADKRSLTRSRCSLRVAPSLPAAST